MSKQIKPTQAKTLCDNYDLKYNELSKFIKKEDNRSCNFSLQELKDYIAYLEKEDPKIDGMRIYLGSNIITNLTTMFICPTVNAVDNVKLNAFNVFGNGFPPKKKYS